MFREFSFEAASRHSSSTCPRSNQTATDIHISPTTTRFTASHERACLSTPYVCSVGDLAQKFRQHNLRVEVNASTQAASSYEPLTTPTDGPTSPADSAYGSRHSSISHMSPGAIRLQRQENTRLQCSENHMRDLSALVEDMVAQGDQCCVFEVGSPPPAKTPIEVDDSDEGVDMGFMGASFHQPRPSLKFRRSGDRLVNQAAVCKKVRVRKSKVFKRA